MAERAAVYAVCAVPAASVDVVIDRGVGVVCTEFELTTPAHPERIAVKQRSVFRQKSLANFAGLQA